MAAWPTRSRCPTPDGRILEALTEGDPEGFPLVFHLGHARAARCRSRCSTVQHGPPACGCITYSRPGYGGSTPWPFSERGPRIADDVVDVLALLHHLGVDEFVTLGWSGGGPRALACAAILPGRCLAAATTLGRGAVRRRGLDWYAGMGEENVDEFAAAGQGATTYHHSCASWPAPDGEPARPEDLVANLGEPADTGRRGVPDRRVRRRTGDAFGRKAREQGVVGWRDDGLAMVGDWGFDVADITVPVSIWHGRQDAMVPPAHGEWLASHVPSARPHLLDDQGHLSLWARSTTSSPTSRTSPASDAPHLREARREARSMTAAPDRFFGVRRCGPAGRGSRAQHLLVHPVVRDRDREQLAGASPEPDQHAVEPMTRPEHVGEQVAQPGRRRLPPVPAAPGQAAAVGARRPRAAVGAGAGEPRDAAASSSFSGGRTSTRPT